MRETDIGRQTSDVRLWHVVLPLLIFLTAVGHAQTIYTTVLGNQNHVVGSSTLRSGLFVSRDGAETWWHVGPENLKAYSMDAVDTSNGRILYIAAGNGVHRSTDYGATWKIVTDWRVTEVLDVKVDQRNPDFVYAATAWGFWRSTDGGHTWENPEGEYQDRYLYQLRPLYEKGMLYNLQVMTDSSRQWPHTASATLLPSSPPLKVEITDTLRLDVTFANTPVDQNPDWFHAYDITMMTIVGKQWRRAFANRSGLWIDTARRDDGIWHVERYKHIAAPTNNPIHALAAFNHGSVLLAGTFGDGLYKWDGNEWSFAGLPGSQVWRIVVKDYDVPVEVGHGH